jgi:hypothetical protein
MISSNIALHWCTTPGCIVVGCARGRDDGENGNGHDRRDTVPGSKPPVVPKLRVPRVPVVAVDGVVLGVIALFVAVVGEG